METKNLHDVSNEALGAVMHRYEGCTVSTIIDGLVDNAINVLRCTYSGSSANEVNAICDVIIHGLALLSDYSIDVDRKLLTRLEEYLYMD